MKRKRRCQSEWVKICEAYDASGETAAVFAARRGLNPHTLAWWRSKLGREGAMGGPGVTFVEVESELQERSRKVVVRLGVLAIEFDQGLPPISWLAELAAQC